MFVCPMPDVSIISRFSLNNQENDDEYALHTSQENSVTQNKANVVANYSVHM